MRLRSAALSFTFIFISMIVVIVFGIESRKFAGFTKEIINKVLEKKKIGSIDFQHFEISLIPLGVAVINPQISIKTQTMMLNLSLGEIGLYLSLFELDGSFLDVTRLEIINGVVDVDYQKSEQKIEEIKRSDIDFIFRLVNFSPIKIGNILFEEVYFKTPDIQGDIGRLRFGVSQNIFHLKGHVKNTSIGEQEFDDIWVDLSLTRDRLNIQSLKLLSDIHQLRLSGKVFDYYKLKNAELKGEAFAQIYIPELVTEYSSIPWLKIERGEAEVRVNLEGILKNPKLMSSIKINELKSNLFAAENLDILISYANQEINIQQLYFKNQKEVLKLIQPFRFYKLGEEYIESQFEVNLNAVDMNNALTFLQKSLSPIKGKISGDFKIKIKGNKYEFIPGNGARIDNLAVIFDDKNFQLLKAPFIELKGGMLGVYGSTFVIDSTLSMENSLFSIKGEANDKKIDFVVPSGKIRIQDLTDIAGLGFKGQGNFSLSAKGPLDHVVIKTEIDHINSEVLGFHLGKARAAVEVDLAEKRVEIKSLDTILGESQIGGNGWVSFDDLSLDLNFQSQRSNYKDLTQALRPILGGITFLPEDLNFLSKVNCRIYGHSRVEKLKVDAEIIGEQGVAYGETFDRVRTDFKMRDKILFFNKLRLAKGVGSAIADVEVDLNTRKLKVDGTWKDMELNHFSHIEKFPVQFKLISHGKASGGGGFENFKINIGTQLKHPDIEKSDWRESYGNMIATPGTLVSKFSFFHDRVNLDFDYKYNPKLLSTFSITTEVDDIKQLIVGMFGGHNSGVDISGRLDAEFGGDFVENFVFHNLRAHIKNFVFSGPGVDVNYSNSQPQFIIEDKIIKKWDLFIKQTGVSFQTIAKGNLSNNAQFSANLGFNAKLLPIFLDRINSSDGMVEVGAFTNIRDERAHISLISRSNDLDLAFEGLPFALQKTNYEISYLQGKFNIKKFRANVDNGYIDLAGDVFLDDAWPDINIAYKLHEAEIPIQSKSTLMFSGSGVVLGNTSPYLVTGDLVLDRGTIANELEDFQTTSASSDIRFLPAGKIPWWKTLFNMNLSMKIKENLRISNSLLDVSLRGDMRISGLLGKPTGDGKIYAPANTSRIFFKNSEYLIQRAELYFSGKKEITNPNFDVQTVSMISNYRVNSRAVGDLERFSFDLTSDPPLPRNGILSLIAFGYTDEMERNLSQGERQNLSQVGVGSFVVDRFKINDVLKKQLGLQLNLGTVFEQSQSSMIAGRGQDSTGIVGRTRSATKVEVRKKLDEALSLSVSSTMGGTIGQRQSMNLNYSLNKNLQLEGVYELKTNVDGEEDVIDTSAGADVKLRWSFR